MPLTRADRDAWTAAKAKYELSIEQATIPLDERDQDQDVELSWDEQELLYGEDRTPEVEPTWESLP